LKTKGFCNKMARPTIPTRLKIIKGTAKKCRLNPNEPKPARTIPSAPAHLSDHAKVVWGSVSTILDRMGVLTEADAIALEALCETVADLRAARQSLRLPVKLQYKNADGEAVEEVVAEGGHQTYLTIGKSGAMQRNRSEMALIADADRRLIAWCAKFGMTAADRAKVSSLGEEEDTNPFAEFGS
jgi:P27 family predicted phage terminase small subunit